MPVLLGQELVTTGAVVRILVDTQTKSLSLPGAQNSVMFHHKMRWKKNHRHEICDAIMNLIHNAFLVCFKCIHPNHGPVGKGMLCIDLIKDQHKFVFFVYNDP